MIETAIKLEVIPSEDYSFSVRIVRGTEYELVYRETGGRVETISFAGLNEMEAVCQAMSKAIECARI